MPVTARLSRAFYEKLGENIAQELVDWFNMVDATYRHDLREINELNFARFDAKLEQRVAALDTKLEQLVAALDSKLEQRVAALDSKLEQRVAALNSKLAQCVAELNAKLEQRVAEVNAKMDTGFARMSEHVEKRIASLRSDLIKWMFVFWATNVLIVFGLVTRFIQR